MTEPRAIRAYHRVSLVVAVDMESDNNFYSGLTRDISRGGVFVATYTPPPPGALVEMALCLPTALELFEVRGIVRWTRKPHEANDGHPPGCGIEWVELSERVMRAIEAFVRHRESLFFDTDDLFTAT